MNGVLPHVEESDCVKVEDNYVSLMHGQLEELSLLTMKKRLVPISTKVELPVQKTQTWESCAHAYHNGSKNPLGHTECV